MKKQLSILKRFLITIYFVNRKMVMGNLFLRVLSALLPIATLWIGKLIIDAISEHLSIHYVFILIVIEAFCGIVLLFSNRLTRLFNELINQDFSIKVSSRIIRHANTFSVEELEDAEFYNLMSRAVDQTGNASEMIEHILEDIELVISIIVYSASILFFSPWVIILFIISLVPSIIGEYNFYIKFYTLQKSWTDNRREINYLTWLSTTESNLKEIKIFRLSDYLVEKLTKKKENYYNLHKNLRKKQVVTCGSFAVVSLLFYYFAYAYVVYNAFVGLISIGTVIYLSGALKNINTSFSRLFSSFTWLSYQSLFINDYFQFMDKKSQKSVSFRNKQVLTIENIIELIDVGFKYPKSDKWALRHVNINIPVGQKLAILGANGCGKTTLLKILTGLYQTTEGKILVDGVALSDIKDCQKLFGIIFQDYIKYEFEGQENIGISNLERMDDIAQIEECAQKSGAADFIEKLPLKYHQVFSNRFKNGMQLSGGEWQKIAVARAMFSNRPVLILDEPTASMDILSEKRLFENLLSNYANEKKKTIIVVSHRLSQIKDIDRIIVMEDGQIVEDGKHQELLKNKGTYYKMYEAYVNS